MCGAKLYGQTTAGSSSKKKTFRLPSGFATVRYSVESRYGPGGKPIEFNGVKPDVEVLADPKLLLAGKNVEIERARADLVGAKK